MCSLFTIFFLEPWSKGEKKTLGQVGRLAHMGEGSMDPSHEPQQSRGES